MTEQIITDIDNTVYCVELENGMPTSSKTLSLTDSTLTAGEKAQLHAAFELIKLKAS